MTNIYEIILVDGEVWHVEARCLVDAHDFLSDHGKLEHLPIRAIDQWATLAENMTLEQFMNLSGD